VPLQSSNQLCSRGAGRGVAKAFGPGQPPVDRALYLFPLESRPAGPAPVLALWRTRTTIPLEGEEKLL
jgi:hypothetical protein